MNISKQFSELSFFVLTTNPRGWCYFMSVTGEGVRTIMATPLAVQRLEFTLKQLHLACGFPLGYTSMPLPTSHPKRTALSS